MKTRRIFAQPGEPIEIINYLGTSLIKVVPMFDRATPVVVIYPQPGVVQSDHEDVEINNLLTEPLL